MSWRTYRVALTPGWIVLAAIFGAATGALLMFVAYQPLVCR